MTTTRDVTTEQLGPHDWIATADGVTGMGEDRTRALLDLERRRREKAASGVEAEAPTGTSDTP